MFNKIILISIFFLLPISVQANSNIIINQVLPNPENEDEEWIELKNISSVVHDLLNYVIDDEANAGSKPFKVSAQTLIEPGKTLKLFKQQTGIILNNAKQKDQDFADQVNLYDPSGNLIDQLSYSTTNTNEPITKNIPATNTPIPKPTNTEVPRPTNTPTVVPSKTPTPSTELKPTITTPQVKAMTTLITDTPTPSANAPSTGDLPSTVPDSQNTISKHDTEPVIENRTEEETLNTQFFGGLASLFAGLLLIGFSLFRASKKLNFSY